MDCLYCATALQLGNAFVVCAYEAIEGEVIEGVNGIWGQTMAHISNPELISRFMQLR